MDYSKTVNLLKTDFPMKGDLPIREPKMLDEWEKSNLYGKIQEKTKNRPTFLLHDGPPYANGVIHMGHALNKTLKDFVVKFKVLSGFRSPYKPGWDCHGLPIEHALFKKLGKSKHQVPQGEFRKQAAAYALDFVEKQKLDFKRLGILGDWDHPYLTLDKNYEAGILEVFYALKDKGSIYRGKKPGYWCAYDETALAEAEVEYADKKSDSVFVRFPIKTVPGPWSLVPSNSHQSPLRTSFPNVSVGNPQSGPPTETFGGDVKEKFEDSTKDQGLGTRDQGPTTGFFVLIWTTTPWTLPANVGLAFHPDEKYVVLEVNGNHYIVADKLKKSVGEKLKTEIKTVGTGFMGKEAVGLVATNPLHGRDSKAVTARYVTMEDGTGVVHIAPGHGVEDYGVGVEWKLEVISPVDERGRFDGEVGRPELEGKHVLKDANKAVMELLGDNLVFHQGIQHSYPHCWRCKNPIIFRATDQWFLKVDDDLRKKLLAQIDKVKWEPAYGVHRIKGMVEQRPDWCLSRQRHWGAPIAMFFCQACGEFLKDPMVDRQVVEMVRSEGTDAWYAKSVDEILKGLSPQCGKCGKSKFEKEMDILDVWFDSGVSWHSVVEREFSKPKPQTIMYLEGSDQHRGWFQTSLIPTVTLKDKAPYDVVLTHGFVVDGKGHKMSKSMGNVISPQDVIKQYGADILRLWVAMSDYREDVRLSPNIIKQMIDVYRRFRNSFRFLLQNNADFSRPEHQLPFKNMEEIDRWILIHFEEVKQRVIKAYEAYEFHVVLSELNRFAAVTLSGFYFDALKDRFYCEDLKSPLRRSAQTALYHLTKGLCLLLAPLLSFTAEETYVEFRKNSDQNLPESVFLDDLDSLDSFQVDSALNEKYLGILEVRRLVNDVLDKERKSGILKSSQEARVTIDLNQLDPKLKKLFEKTSEDWPFLLQMAEVSFEDSPQGDIPVQVSKTAYLKCERCWRHRKDVGQSKIHPTLCSRCVAVVQSHVPVN